MVVQTARREPSQSTSQWWQDLWDTTAHHPERSFTLTLVNHAPLAYNRYLAAFQKTTVFHALKHIGSLEGKLVLDVGCGQGRWTDLWQSRGADAVGIDISLPLLKANLRRPTDGGSPEKTFAAMAVENLGIADGLIDMISSVTVLQHIPYQKQLRAIREMVRCVRPGGFILIHEHVRRPAGFRGTDDCTTFPNLPGEWVRMFSDHGCRLVFTERCPLMPLFTAYWQVRDRIVRLARPATSRSRPSMRQVQPTGPTPVVGHRAFGKLYRMVNYCVYWLLTWPSWAVEYLLMTLPGEHRWTGQTVLGAHQTFLFRRGTSADESGRRGEIP